MTEPIVRMYPTEQQARDAARALREAGFRPDEIHLVTSAPTHDMESGPPFADAIATGSLSRHQASFYAERVRLGRSLVAINPPFGRGRLATEVLERNCPVDTDLRPSPAPRVPWDEAAPLSRALDLPVLWRSRPAPLSSRLRWRLLLRNPAPLSSALGLRLIARQPAPLSRSLRLPLLLRRRPAPLSAKLGLGTLLPRQPAPLSSRLGLKLLLRNEPAPLSARLGLKLLVRRPAPLSSALGLPLLSREAAPLSSLLGWPVLLANR